MSPALGSWAVEEPGLPWGVGQRGRVGSVPLHTPSSGPSSGESGLGGRTPLRQAALTRVAGDVEK